MEAHFGRFSRTGVLLLFSGLVILVMGAASLRQEPPATSLPTVGPDVPATAQSQPTTQSQPATDAATPAKYFRAWVLVPPIVTIILAILLRQVIPALAIGILVAACMLASFQTQPQTLAGIGDVALGGLTMAVEDFVTGALADVDHAKIIVFTLLIGGMVGVIAANGGTPAIVNAVARWASDRPRGQLATWFAGLVVFFDDYANAMIVGPSMRPVCDRLKISRAKLAYLVDSTAAPVASIALVGTWIGAEIGFIKDGLDALTDRPAFLADVSLDKGFAYGAFLYSIPYRFYPILALVMVFLVGLLNRDFGPMKKAEREAGSRAEPAGTAAGAEQPTGGRAWYAGVPVLVLVIGTLALLVITGWLSVQASGADVSGFEWVQAIVSSGDSYNSILYGALASLVVAVAISLLTRTLSLGRAMDSATASMSRMLPTFVVLVLAWALSAAMQELQLGEAARALLQDSQIDLSWMPLGGYIQPTLQRLKSDPNWLPLLIFVAACVVSFATGTSWGTMGILCPAAVQISAGLLADVPADQAFPLFYASIGGVLAGAVFGDHCSPISDTTVLSSLASECSLEVHVWTQMPYALTVAAVSILCGDVLCRQFHQPAWLGLLAGAAALVLIVLVFGRRPRPRSLPVQESTAP